MNIFVVLQRKLQFLSRPLSFSSPSFLITLFFSPLTTPSYDTHVIVITIVVLESCLNTDAELGEEWYLQGDKEEKWGVEGWGAEIVWKQAAD